MSCSMPIRRVSSGRRAWAWAMRVTPAVASRLVVARLAPSTARRWMVMGGSFPGRGRPGVPVPRWPAAGPPAASAQFTPPGRLWPAPLQAPAAGRLVAPIAGIRIAGTRSGRRRATMAVAPGMRRRGRQLVPRHRAVAIGVEGAEAGLGHRPDLLQRHHAIAVGVEAAEHHADHALTLRAHGTA